MEVTSNVAQDGLHTDLVELENSWAGVIRTVH